MSLAALLMGIGNRAAEVNRRNEQRKYNEELYGKQAQSEYLIKQLEDPDVPYEEKQAHSQSLAKIWGVKPEMIDFARQMHKPLTQMVQQQTPQLSPSITQRQMPSAPVQPPSPTGAPANVQPPLGALSQPTPTLGMPPSPPPAMNEGPPPRSERESKQRAALDFAAANIDRAVAHGILSPDEGAFEKRNLYTSKASLAMWGMAAKQNMAERALDIKRGQLALQGAKYYGTPTTYYVPGEGVVLAYHDPTNPLNMVEHDFDEDGNPLYGEGGKPIMKHFTPRGVEIPWKPGLTTQISQTGKVTTGSRTAQEAAALAGTPAPSVEVPGQKGRVQFPPGSGIPQLPSTIIQQIAPQLKTPEDYKILNPRDKAAALAENVRTGNMPQRELTNQGKQSIEKIEPVIGSMDMLLGKLDPYKANNQRGYFTIPYLKYRTGVTTPEGDIGNSIASLELVKILGAMPYIKGRPNQIFIDAIWKHLPNTIIDSPMTIHDKLTKAKRLLEAYREAALKYEVKGAPPPSPEDLRAAERTVAEIEGTGSSSSNTEDIKRRLKEKYK